MCSVVWVAHKHTHTHTLHGKHIPVVHNIFIITNISQWIFHSFIRGLLLDVIYQNESVAKRVNKKQAFLVILFCLWSVCALDGWCDWHKSKINIEMCRRVPTMANHSSACASWEIYVYSQFLIHLTVKLALIALTSYCAAVLRPSATTKKGEVVNDKNAYYTMTPTYAHTLYGEYTEYN